MLLPEEVTGPTLGREARVAKNSSAARLVRLAAMLASTSQEKARHLQAGLDGNGGHAELAPDPAGAGILVDDKPDPFRDGTDDPVAFLGGRPGNIVPMHPPRERFSATSMAGYIFRTVSMAGTEAEPGLAVFGTGDGLDDGQRAERVRRCQRKDRPFAVIYPIDNIASFLGVRGEGRYASVAIVARDLRRLVVAVSAGRTLAVAQHDELLIAQDDGPLLQPRQPVGGPILPGSYVLLSTAEPGSAACQAGCPRTALCGTALPEPANPILLNGILLGGVEAGYQPECTACEGAASYLAALAGRVILDASRGKKLKYPHQVHDLLGDALRSGERLPSLIVARDDLSARRLFDRVRGCGSA
jgi:hypothetical protein